MLLQTLEECQLDEILNSSLPVDSNGCKILESIKSTNGCRRPTIRNQQSVSTFENDFEKPKTGLDFYAPSSIEKKPFKTNPNSNFTTLTKFECWVIEIDNDIIYARGRDIDQLGSEINFELDINDVDKNDRELVGESSVFMVIVGFFTTEFGQQINKTIIKFRRHASFSNLQRENISKRAKLLAEALGIDD